MAGDDAIAECRKALLDLSDGLWSAASALRWDANPGDFSSRMIKLAPMFERAGVAMANLPGRPGHPD
jgi:hypothetical protein